MVTVTLADGSVWDKNDTMLVNTDFTAGVNAPSGAFTLIDYYTVGRSETLAVKASSVNSEIFHHPMNFDLQTTVPADVGNNTIVQVVHMDGTRRRDIQILLESIHGNLEQTTLQRDLLNYFTVNAVIPSDNVFGLKANAISGETVRANTADPFQFKLTRFVRMG